MSRYKARAPRVLLSVYIQKRNRAEARVIKRSKSR